MRVDRTGTYKAVPVAWAVGKTKNEFATFNVKVKLVEFYDSDSGEWVSWDEYGVEENVYLCLVGTDKKTKQQVLTANHTQVMTVFGWDGESLQDLDNGDYSELVFQVRYKDNDPEYADKNPFTASWIDVEDADPVSGLSKLDPKDLKDLNASFAMLAKAAGKGKKAVGKKDAKPKTPPAAPPKATTKPLTPAQKRRAMKAKEAEAEAEAEAVVETPEQKKANLLEKSKKNLADRKPTVTAPPPARKATPEITGITGDGCTKAKAWTTIVELKSDDVTDDTLRDVFYGAVDEVAGEGVDEKTVTPEQWFTVMHRTLDQVGKF